MVQVRVETAWYSSATDRDEVEYNGFDSCELDAIVLIELIGSYLSWKVFNRKVESFDTV